MTTLPGVDLTHNNSPPGNGFQWNLGRRRRRRMLMEVILMLLVTVRVPPMVVAACDSTKS
jgi:hypothetical protein